MAKITGQPEIVPEFPESTALSGRKTELHKLQPIDNVCYTNALHSDVANADKLFDLNDSGGAGSQSLPLRQSLNSCH